MSNESIIIIAILSLVVMFWVLRISSVFLIAYANFILTLHPVVIILIFILFPPAFIAFIIGLYMSWYYFKEGNEDNFQEPSGLEKNNNETIVETEYEPSSFRGYIYLSLIITIIVLTIFGVIKFEI